MRRRQFVASASATVAAASVAGCSDVLGGGDDGSDPADPVEAYLKAAVEGDEAELREALHPEAAREMAVAAGILSMAERIEIQDTEVLEESEEAATVEVTYETETGGDSSTSTDTYVVRKHEGDWKVYSG